MVAMATGKVKWFNNQKGYGFILAHTGGEDLFVHYSSIQMDGYRTLKAGQSVEFDIQQGPKGLHAVNIRLDPNAVVDGEAIVPAASQALRDYRGEVAETGD
jgi:CspA family cold shock protein